MSYDSIVDVNAIRNCLDRIKEIQVIQMNRLDATFVLLHDILQVLEKMHELGKTDRKKATKRSSRAHKTV